MKPTHSNALRRQLARSRDAGPHPDANLLSAFAEDALLAREREQILGHLVACPSCRETLRLSSAAAEEPQPALLPLPASRPAPSVFRNWITGTAMAACIVAIVGSAILLRHAIRTSEAQPPVAVSQPAKTTTQPPPQIASAAGSPSTQQQAATQRPPRAIPKHPRGSAQSRATSSASAHPMPPAVTEQVQVAPQNSQAEPTQEANATTPTPPAQAPSGFVGGAMPAQKSVSPAPQQYSPAQSQQRAVYSSHSAATSGARTAARNQPSFAGNASARGLSSFAPRPVPHPQWRIGDAGQIEHITDSGTWQPIPVGQNVNFRVVTVSHQEVWAGGDHLALFHSADNGATWTEVHLPAAADRAHAIVNIDLNNAPKLTVESDSGTTWTTNDAGQTWQ